MSSERAERTQAMTDKMKTDGGPTDMAVPEIVSILPLRDLVVFPHAVVPLAAGRESSLRLIEDAVRTGHPIGTFGQLDATMDAPTENDLHRIGTYTTIHKVIKQPDGPVRLAVQGLSRIRLVEVVQTHPFIKARVEEVPEIMPPAGDLESEALVRNATNLFRKIVELSPHLPDELAEAIANVTHAGRLADAIAASLPSFTPLAKQELLATADVKARLQRLVALLTKEAEVLELGSRIQSQVESEVGKGQRDYYLREQLKAIQKELGQSDDRTEEIDELRGKIEAAGMTDEAKKEALRELDRLSKMPPAAAEYTVARTYLEWLVALPWSKETEDTLDLAQARTVLDDDHSGLEKVKDRVLEYLAVKSMRPIGRDPILCFVGPPGVGKTSLGRSIARALGRKFHRISLGGMRDEAEIRGHRRTYIGALPGQIIQGLRRAESKNPVLMLDEIDKLGMDFRGDPASALPPLIRHYTREAGLRNLEREIATITRKIAKRRVEGRTEPVEVTPELVGDLLGAPRFLVEELEERTRVPGVAIGLAWTPAGGDILFIEATRMKGGKTLTLTGQLGDVMKESVQAALSWVRSHATELGIRSDFWDISDIHVHIPAGAIPKDGPSAGVTMVMALASLMSGRAIKPRLAMTGEVTLSGRVLAVGGIKEKVLAARRAGVTTVILPRRNEKNLLEDVPRLLRESMTFHLVDSVEEVLDLALEDALPRNRRIKDVLVPSRN